jgi:hypothetical protein
MSCRRTKEGSALHFGTRHGLFTAVLASFPTTAFGQGASSDVSVERAPIAEPAPRATPKPKHGDFRHDGFYLAVEGGTGVMVVHSNRSLSNGFLQPIASTASGLVWPNADVAIGGTLWDSGVVIAGRGGAAQIKSPAISTMGERFEIPSLTLTFVHFEAIVDYYVAPKKGTHLGVAIGAASLEGHSDYSDGESARGWTASLEAGHNFWVRPQLSLGMAFRVTGAILNRDAPINASVFLPSLLATLAWH